MFGYIYSLTCDETSDVYIGSSTTTPKKRLRAHKTDKLPSCVHILESPTLKMNILENIFEESRVYLWQKERWYIDNTPNCINKTKPILTSEDLLLNKEKQKAKRYLKKITLWEEKYEKNNPDQSR
jgi:predicted GIY-YIG superfamily endonuclease